MPWNNQTGGGGKGGGPWGGGSGGGGGGGPWGNSGGPWGSGPQRGGGGGGGSPDLEDLLRRGQERLKSVLPGGGGFGVKGIVLAVVVVAALWGATGLYRVEPGEVGVELVLGKYIGMTQPGLNYNLPYPIGRVETPDVLRIREVSVGLRELENNRTTGGARDVPEESLMLTGDENIVDVDFKAFWRINNAADYLFNIQNPEATVKAVSESAMREVVGRINIQRLLTDQREQVQIDVQQLMQRTLDNYKSGIEITEVQMLKVDPPQQVIDAFRDVQAARADQERLQNEAQSYANRVIPEARGEAARVIEGASAYRDRTIAEARGQADRFTKIYDEYRKAPDVTRERIYIETMEQVLGGTDKVIIDNQSGGQGVVPYLPLGELGRAQPGPRTPAAPQPARTGANQ